MKYCEMVKFLNDNGILLIQPIIADAVDSLYPLDTILYDEDFEEICEAVYRAYMGIISDSEPDIYELVREEFKKRNIGVCV